MLRTHGSSAAKRTLLKSHGSKCIVKDCKVFNQPLNCLRLPALSATMDLQVNASETIPFLETVWKCRLQAKKSKLVSKIGRPVMRSAWRGIAVK